MFAFIVNFSFWQWPSDDTVKNLVRQTGPLHEKTLTFCTTDRKQDASLFAEFSVFKVSPAFATIGLLVCSNLFMTLAWYGHLKFKMEKLWVVILVS